MKKTRAGETRCNKVLPALLLIVIVFAAPSRAQDLTTTQNLIRNLACIIAWLMPAALSAFLIGGGILILTGSQSGRVLGKKLIKNAASAFIMMIILYAAVSLTMPEVKIGICYGAVPIIENHPPVAEARAGFNRQSATEKSVEVTLGDYVYFDGSLSWDPDGAVVYYLWDYGDGSYGMESRTEHAYYKTGRYLARLNVKDDKGAFSAMPSTVRIVVNPPTTPGGRVVPNVPQTTTTSTTLAIAPTTLPGEDTTTTTTTRVIPTWPVKPKLTLLFVPLGWISGMQAFNSAADQQANFLISNIPLKACPAKVKILKLPENCPYNLPMTEDGCSSQVRNILLTIKSCADRMGQPYDYAVGLSDRDVCGSIAGFSMRIGAVFAESRALVVTAHELGHEWSLVDEYMDWCRCAGGGPNCLDASMGGSDGARGFSSEYCAGGSRCAGYQITCAGNKNPLGGRCIMSYANAPAPRAYCSKCYSHLSNMGFMKC